MQKRIEECIQSVEVAGASGVILQTTARRFTDFLNSIKKQVKNKTLSPGQRKYLAVICAEYYENAPDGQSYFRETRRKVIDNPKGHVLSKKDFTRMCMNKYADKVIRESQSDPRFVKGQMVQLRASNRIDMYPTETREERTRYYKMYRQAARGEKVMGMILEVNARPIYRSTVGGKVYKVLPIGDSDTAS